MRVGPIIIARRYIYPDVSIDLTMGERMVDLVEEGFDLAIRPTPPPDSSLIVRHLVSWRPVLCCAPAYLLKHEPLRRPEDLVRHNCLRYAFFPFGDEWRFIGPAGERSAVRVSGRLVTNSAEALRQVALSGQGLFLAPIFVAVADLKAGRLVRVLDDYTPVEFTINAIYPHRHHLSAKVRTFLDLVVERFAEHGRWMSAPPD